MTLRGIDISSWQKGLDVTAVPLDFVLVKATQGTNYVSPDCARVVDQALGAGKMAGVYHYVSGGNAIAEADYFVSQIRGWIGRVVIAIDWESNQNSAWGNTDYLKQMAQRVIDKTGVKPLIYASSSAFPWDVCKSLDLGAWVAQYADMNFTEYQDTPWNDTAYGCVIRQYSSSGRLPGWSGNLDLNKFYGDAATWRAYASVNGKPAPAPAPAPNNRVGATVHYGLRRLNGAWLGDVVDFNNVNSNGFAGLPGGSHDYLYAYVSTGDLRYRVHIIGGDWLNWVNHGNKTDPVNGLAGTGGRIIDGVQFYYTTPAGQNTKQAWYRSQTAKRSGWLGTCCDDGTSIPGYDGFAGIIGEPLDRLQLVVTDSKPF